MNEFFIALKNRRARKEYIKSILVGMFSTGIDFLLQALILYAAGNKYYSGFFSVFTGATKPGVEYTIPISVYMMTIFVCFTVSIMVNYILSVFFVFEYGNVGKNKSGFLKFCVFSLFGLSITITGSMIGFAGIGANVWIIKIVMTVFVFVFNFFTRKYFVFNIALIRNDDQTINL